jgi:hypothetical protein
VDSPSDYELGIIGKIMRLDPNITEAQREQYEGYARVEGREFFNRQRALKESKRQFIESQNISEDVNTLTLPGTSEHEDLLTRYQENGVKARYVSFDDLANEPPCAGAFYDGEENGQ